MKIKQLLLITALTATTISAMNLKPMHTYASNQIETTKHDDVHHHATPEKHGFTTTTTNSNQTATKANRELAKAERNYYLAEEKAFNSRVQLSKAKKAGKKATTPTSQKAADLKISHLQKIVQTDQLKFKTAKKAYYKALKAAN